jgi:hypothetical protein
VHRDSFVVVAFDDVKEVYSHNLEYHTKMVSIRASVDKRIDQLHNMTIIPRELLSFLLATLNQIIKYKKRTFL